MSILLASIHPNIGSASKSVCMAAVIAIATWTTASTAGVAWCHQVAASYAGAKVFPPALTARPATIAAIDEENDGDEDQADPNDPNDTVAAADVTPSRAA